MKRLQLLRLGLIWLLLSGGAYGQDTSPFPSFRKLYGGIGMHGGLGWGYSKNTVSSYYNNVFLPHGGLDARLFVTKRWAISPSVDYLSLGDKSKSSTSLLVERFRTLQGGLNIEVFLGSSIHTTVATLRGGIFGGRILKAGFYWTEYVDQKSGYSSNPDDYGKWNAGVSLGAEVIRRINKTHSLSLYGQYDNGLITVMNPNNSLIKGKVLTRAYRFGLGYTFK